VVVVDRIERDVAVIAAAASNPHTATQKAIRYLQQQGSGWCKLPIIPAC
jgi:3-hydroxybutyryl-CoA dehydrogenase